MVSTGGSSTPVAPANLEIPRDVVAGWEREAEASGPSRQECGCDSWWEYSARSPVEDICGDEGIVWWVSCCTPLLCLPCFVFGDKLACDSCLACWVQPWGPYGLCVCVCCWDSTYPAWLQKQKPSAEQIQRHRDAHVAKRTAEYRREQQRDAAAAEKAAAKQAAAEVKAAAPERVKELERSLESAEAELQRAVDSGQAATSGDAASVRKRLQQLRRDRDAAVAAQDFRTATPLQDEIASLEKREPLVAKVEQLTSDLEQARATAARIKQEEAKEARANAKNDLHRAMFKVADELGGTYSTLREANGHARFDAKDLVFGRPQEAALGLADYMCVDDDVLRDEMTGGLAAIRAEIDANGTDVDRECLKYVLEKEAGTSNEAFQGGLKRDCDAEGNVLPERRGKFFADFVAHPNSQTARLKEPHVAALRFYTTAGFRTINDELRNQARQKAGKRHPFPVTVAFAKEALGKLRALDAPNAKKPTNAPKTTKPNNEVILYRGMKGMKVPEEFMRKGGTELAPMSTTSSLKIAMEYSASEHSLLLRLFTSSFMVRGPDISFLSAFPAEKEYLFPPLTYLMPTGNVEELRIDDAMFTVIDVEPQQ